MHCKKRTIALNMSSLLFLASLQTFALSCGTSDFTAAKPKARKEVTQTEESRNNKAPGERDASADPDINKKTETDGAEAPKNDQAVAKPTPPPETGVMPPMEETLCKRAAKQNVLIIDLKSGWFAGDGGTLFQSLVKTECAEKVEIHYAHVTNEVIETNFLGLVKDPEKIFSCMDRQGKVQGNIADCSMGDLRGYQQIWILSGSFADSSDLRPGSKNQSGIVFEEFLDRIRFRIAQAATCSRKKGAPIALFVGAGLSNNDHANFLADGFFTNLSADDALCQGGQDLESESEPYVAPLFSLRNELGENGKAVAHAVNPSPSYGELFAADPLKPSLKGMPGTFLSDFSALQGLSSLFDYKKEKHHADPKKDSSLEIGKCFSDPIVSKQLTSYAWDHCGNTSIAAGSIQNHQVYLEGNMARFYGTGAIPYFQRILNYLSQR